VPNEPSLPSPAPEILEYLSRHPNAQDTIEGILQWWVLDSCLRNWAPRIAATVQQLVDDDFLEKRTAGDGRLFYRISPRHLARLRGDASNNS
jgi:hypothetical protein